MGKQILVYTYNGRDSELKTNILLIYRMTYMNLKIIIVNEKNIHGPKIIDQQEYTWYNSTDLKF